MHISNKFKFLVVALTVMTFANVGSVAAQPPGTPAQTMSVPPNPQAWCEEGGYCDNGGTPPVAQTPPPRVRRPQPTQWNIVVNGSLDGNVRQHGTIDTDVGVAEFGIGGTPVCPRGFIDLVIAPSGLTRLREAAGHRLVRGVYCARDDGSMRPGDETDIDLSLYVTYEVFNLLVARVARLEDRMDQNDAVDVGQERDRQQDVAESDNDRETQYRFECADKMDLVTFQEWEAATPARRVELCPPTIIVNNDGDRMHYRLRLGGQLMIGSSIDSTLMTAGLATLGVEFFSANNRHGLILRGEIGSADMRGTQGHAPIGRATLFGGSLAFGFRPLNWATIALGGRVLGLSDHNGDPDVYHGYRGTLAGPELALTLDRQIGDGPFGVSFRLSASFLRGQVNYWINEEEVRAGRSSVNLGLGVEITYGR